MALKLLLGAWVCMLTPGRLWVGAAEPGLSFVTLGDWGGAALGGDSAYAPATVEAVAHQMAKTMLQRHAQFVVNTGDNFYWCGIQNTSDFQINTDWVEPYHSVPMVPWYSALGNHEYGYSVEAQLQLGAIYPTWVLPERYYSKRLQLSGTHYLSLIVIDSSPCVSEYRSSDPAGWDPCSTKYPTCSLTTNHSDHFEGKCRFNANILTQDCSAQLEWFKATLAAVPASDWLIVVAHHPVDEMDVEDFTAALQARGFDLFLNGHAHTLSQYSIDGGGAYITSGAGALVHTSDQEPTTPGSTSTHQKVEGETGTTIFNAFNHTYKTIFNKKVAGFTAHTFSDDYQTLTSDFIDNTGAVLHSFSVTRGRAPPPPPSPMPSPPAPPKGTKCCHLHDTHCNAGDVCCREKCDTPSAECTYKTASSCSHYGHAHHCRFTDGICTVRPVDH